VTVCILYCGKGCLIYCYVVCVFYVCGIVVGGPWAVGWVFFKCYVVKLLGICRCFFFPWSCVGAIIGVNVDCVDCVCVVVVRCFNVF